MSKKNTPDQLHILEALEKKRALENERMASTAATTDVSEVPTGPGEAREEAGASCTATLLVAAVVVAIASAMN